MAHTLKVIILHLLLVIAIASVAYAESQEVMSTVSATNELVNIQRQLKEVQAAYSAEIESLPDTLEGNQRRQELCVRSGEKQADHYQAAVELAKANPKSELGFAALEWVLTNNDGVLGIDLMADQYAENPKIRSVIAIFSGASIPRERTSLSLPAQAAVDLLTAVVERNPDRTVRAQAALGLAWCAKYALGAAVYTHSPDADRLAVEAERAYEVVIRDYGTCTNLATVWGLLATGTLGEVAESELFELRQLRIGSVAPDIEGEDLDGAQIKLSDYRGKVVLLVFWASWCGPCMANVPHENELVERFKGRPFALIGVNGDATKEDAQKAVVENNIPWRSFWNGKDGPMGPIAKTWNVQEWPTVYVLDHKGVIREKYAVGEHLDDPLEKLVSAAEVNQRGLE